ncbi:MAG TPA: DUF1552 domain-containing protein [Pirellulales bacterium]|jgi:hypothetical protein|nr:DUF1552 domain-containing protein [Pirellulales bacterium]
MNQSWRISRRSALRGLGTTLALPLLDSMLPGTAFSPFARALQAAETAKQMPNRAAFVYVPNGMHMADWTPTQVGAGFDLPPILATLSPVQGDFMVISGLAQDGGRAHGDGGGDHARAMASFLTGTHPKKTHGADIRAGVSADQMAAQKVGKITRFASLELGCDAGAQSGNCDTGYSCAYSANAVWATESQPVAKEVNPRLVFERLFTDGPPGEKQEAKTRRQRYRLSVLDFALEDATSLKRRLGSNDQRKLDEYLTTVRELEARIARSEQSAAQGAVFSAGFAKPAGVPEDYGEHIRLMFDLMVLAFQADLTRVITFVHANEGSNRSYPFIGVSDGHHDLSHHAGDPEKQAKISKINQFHASHLARFLQKLKETPEGDGNLLDHSMIAYGSAIGDGNRHNHDDLPILLAGRGCGTLKPGRHIRYERETPLNNLWLSMLERLGAHVDRLGDGKGTLAELNS